MSIAVAEPVLSLAAWNTKQDAALRRKALHPDPVESNTDADAYWDVANEWTKLRTLLIAARKQATELENVADRCGVRLPGIAREIADELDGVEDNICAESHVEALVQRITQWEERN